MNFDFELILFYATLITGVLALLDIIFFAPRRKKKSGERAKLPLIMDYSRSFFPILLIVFLLRSFLFEPFRIPSGSLEPTLQIGDFILLNKFDYGLRLPILRKEIIPVGKPERGDIMVFRWPPNPSYYFIKRVIGLPGDHIKYVNKELTVNGQKIPQEFLQLTTAQGDDNHLWQATEKQENLLGVKHLIFVDPTKKSRNFEDIVVPKGMYFVMGDNRDDSADSRYWGFVPDKNIVGKAVLIWLSWDSAKFGLRWDRLGKLIH
jgi:signal peptidase I